MGAMTIGAVAAASGVSRDTIRYYERRGLLPRVPRTPAGYRQYGDGVVRRLAVIRNAQRFGFSLHAIGGFLRVRDSGGKPCHDVKAAGERMLKTVDQQIAELRATRRRMSATLRTWDRALQQAAKSERAYLLERL